MFGESGDINANYFCDGASDIVFLGWNSWRTSHLRAVLAQNCTSPGPWAGFYTTNLGVMRTSEIN